MENELFTYETFTPAEAERITGVNVVLQRDWRHRGYLPKGKGHARFDVFDLAKLAFMKILTDRGIGPKDSADVSEYAALAMVASAASSIDFWAGDHREALTWGHLPSTPAPTEVFDLLVSSGNIHDTPEAKAALTNDNLDSSWGYKAGWLKRKLLRSKGYRVEPAPMFLWWANGEHFFTKSVDYAISQLSPHAPELNGAIVFLDLEVMASSITDKAGRPFVVVCFERDENGLLMSPFYNPNTAANAATQTPQ
jgi:hypothetical protein